MKGILKNMEPTQDPIGPTPSMEPAKPQCLEECGLHVHLWGSDNHKSGQAFQLPTSSFLTNKVGI